ncbi:HNH endonuclease [Herbaspirillum camelliae]|uniref:HNH endonuclease n=1 Tax=Herbaspirillum camelliae TaxID=1892903 RepID=UPI000949D580|nr:HNH endonuclease [Herbaspirillum camelliae]
MDPIEYAKAFYLQHYTVLNMWNITPGVRVVLGSGDPQACRFCQRQAPEVTFRLKAHAIPEALGNKGMLSRYECDECNKHFGSTIENDLGNWSLPMRTLLRIYGKNGVPTLKNKRDGWRIECDDGTELRVSHNRIDSVFEVDEAQKLIRFNLKRGPFVPLAVRKALVKIGLTLLPEVEVPNFAEAIRWIRDPEHPNERMVRMPVLRTLRPGPMNGQMISAAVLRRSEHSGGLPYAFLILSIANETYQVMLPSPQLDPPLDAAPMQMPVFPAGLGQNRDSICAALNLSESERVVDEALSAVMSYGARIPR